MSLVVAGLNEHWTSLSLVWVTYLVATASPGPANMAILATAVQRGRSPALAVGAGVLVGSMTWAVLAALGLSAVLAQWSEVLIALKVIGGLYLLYLAWRAARAAVRAEPVEGTAAPRVETLRRQFWLGLSLHLTNPKAILTWLAIVSIGMPAAAPIAVTVAMLVGCALIGALVFGGYALAFSEVSVASRFRRAHRWIQATLALVFGYAGLRLLTWRA